MNRNSKVSDIKKNENLPKDGTDFRAKKKTAKEIIAKFSRTCSMHGLGEFINCKTIWLKFIWFSLIISSLGGCIYFIIFAFIDYFSYNVISNYNVYNSVPMELPTLTICNMNSYKSKQNLTLEQMLLTCRYENSLCTVEDFVQFKVSTYTCYSLNSGKLRNGTEIKPIQTSKKGFLYGFGLRLFAGLDEQAFLYLNGFLVFVHDRNDFPLTQQAIQVSSGLYTRIKVYSFFLK